MKESIMTKIKLCGLTRECDIRAANELLPEYIGFVFAKKSRRYVSPERAAELRRILDRRITAVGVFVNKDADTVVDLLRKGTIDIAQLHGDEDEDYIAKLRRLSNKPVIKACRISDKSDTEIASRSTADYVLLDSGSGTGKLFDWSLIGEINRPYFLAGGLDSVTAVEAVAALHPYAVDVSSGIETGGFKDENKMKCFVHAVRSADGKEI